ncbi:DUF1311 domain-containing protein [Sulfitobacter sp. S0837]|nr:DUF1311 domain-containing protein [Sulfitobacter maritimus]
MRCLLALPFVMLAGFEAQAQASFDCNLAATTVEKTICADAALSKLDRQMADAFKSARRSASKSKSASILADQRAWIGQRNACSSDRRCLRNAMQKRIADLKAPTSVQTTGLTGLYCTDTAVMGLQEQGQNLRFDFMFFSGHFACGTGVLTGRRSGSGWTSSSNGCRLTLTKEGGSMVVRSDTVDTCRALYCGAGAAISEFRMPLSGKVPGVTNPFAEAVGERQC